LPQEVARKAWASPWHTRVDAPGEAALRDYESYGGGADDDARDARKLLEQIDKHMKPA
jgi:hypothetical protein